MIGDEEWNTITRKAFPKRSVKAPPYLWTRVLAAIDAEEARLSTAWWMQWRWMIRLTFATAVLVSLGSYYLWNQSVLPLDFALEGRTTQLHAIQLASSELTTPDDSAVLVLGTDS
jgi:hypothetical protein